jgi:Flp pilus assembly protein TadG
LSMKLRRGSLVSRLLKDEVGQALPILTFGIMSLIGLVGISTEVGHGYYALEVLQASTNSAALAGAQGLPNTTTATANVAEYSAQTSDANTSGILQNVTATPTFLCLTTISTLGTPCRNANGAGGGYNSIKVVQTARTPLWIGNVFGLPYFYLSATGTAAMQGGENIPQNIAVIMDTTASMGGQDNTNQCSGTQISCALLGFQALLVDLYPCALGVTCGSSTPVDSVSLFVFPPLTTATASKDYTCPTSNPTIVQYTFNNPPTDPTLPSGDTYQVVGFSSDYKTTDADTTLNPSSALVVAAGAKSGCTGLQAPGGQGTYYAQAIYAAQAALVAEQANNTGSQNVLILLSDGNATACATTANTSAGGCNTKNNLVAKSGTLNGLGTSTSTVYPSALGQCGQAVQAAQAAQTAGTTVFTIGYGSPGTGSSSNCGSDTKYSTTSSTGWTPWKVDDSPCAALAAMSSQQKDFFSDDSNGCLASYTPNQGITNFKAIFQAISGALTAPRLIPNGTT